MSRTTEVCLTIAAVAVVVVAAIWTLEHVQCFNWWPFAKGCVVK